MTDQTVQSFVDSAIAARREDYGVPLLRRRARQFSGFIRARCGEKTDDRTVGGKGIDSRVQSRPCSPLQPTGERVVNDSDTMK